MVKRRKPEDYYEHILNSNQNRNSPVVKSLKRAHDARVERIRLINKHCPYWFDGIDEVLIGLQSIRSQTGSEELKSLLARAEAEALRGAEAILSADEQTLNDSSRVLMEIEVLLMEWSLDADRMEAWGKTDQHTRHRIYGFGKVLERIKYKKKVDDNLEMPERMEYNIHSITLHPHPGETISLLQAFDLQTSELVAHLGRIFRRTFEAVRIVGSPIEIPEEDIRIPGETWERLLQEFVGGRDQYIATMLAARGMRMLPRRPLPKGMSRIVPIVPTDETGASFFK